MIWITAPGTPKGFFLRQWKLAVLNDLCCLTERFYLQTLVIPFEERKYKTGAGFGKEGESERNHCSEIMKATRKSILT